MNAVITAIQKAQINKDRRFKTVIVSGFIEDSSAGSDRDKFRWLCSTELHTEPDIIYVKRLGTSQDRARPLLVAVRTSGEAAVLACAEIKVSEQTCSQRYAKNSLYINSNLS